MANSAQNRTVLIAGPTASGKSAAALVIAEQTGGEIVNADALQVYADLRVLSARPSPEEERAAPHHLYGHVDGAARYSAGEWSKAAAAAIAGIHARGALAIVVGGTGLYFRALEHGLSEIPAVPEPVRIAAVRRYEEIGPTAFRREVLAIDPVMARLEPADRQRHIRAWEVYEACGETLSSFQAKPVTPAITEISARILIDPPREDVYRNCEMRLDLMLAGGAIDEARALAARKLSPVLPVMKAVGAAELLMHVSGAISIDEAKALAKRNTRRYAKRQMTWFRRQTPDWPRARSAQSAAAAILSQFVACSPREG